MGQQFTWGEVLEYTPVGEGRKIGLQGRVGFSEVTMGTSANPRRAQELMA